MKNSRYPCAGVFRVVSQRLRSWGGLTCSLRAGAWALARGGWGGGKFAGLAQVLDTGSAALHGVEKVLEGKVNALSDRLEQLPGCGRRLVTESEAYLAQASGRGLEGELFPPIIALLDPALAFLRQCGPKLRGLCSSLREISTTIDGVLADEEATFAAMSQLRFVRPMIRIEAARFDTEVEESVLSLVAQIETLTADIKDALLRKLAVLRGAQETIHGIGDGLARSAEKTAATVERHDRSIQTLLESFRRGLEQNAHRDIRLTAVAREVATLVGRMVVSLQTQDIVSQRLAHLREGLDRLGDALRARSARTALKLARVAAAQLSATAGEVEQAERDLREAAARARELLSGVERSCLDLPEFEIKTVGEQGLASVLMGTVEAFQAVVQEVAQQIRTWAGEVEPLGGNAAGASQQMRGMSVGIRIIALNFQIHSSNIDGGRTLDVLSSFVSTVAKEATECAQSGARQSDAVVRSLNDLVEDFAAFQEMGSETAACLEAAREDAVRPLRQLAERAAAGRAAVLATIAQASSLLAAMEQHVGLSGVFAPAVAPLGAALQEIIAALEPLASVEDDGAVEEVDGLARGYTMESERLIHASALSSTGSVALPAARPAAPPAEAEFFSLPEPVARPAATEPSAARSVAPVAAAPAGEIEFF